MPSFSVVPGTVVRRFLQERSGVAGCVRDAYVQHGLGATVNPDSYFLRFPDRPQDRIIALPGRISADNGTSVAGIKWISSFPGNVETGLPRASAVLILNDPATGYPYGCLEAAGISAARTAASAVLTARTIAEHLPARGDIGFVGAGVIARTIAEYLAADDVLPFTNARVHDLDATSAGHLVASIRAQGVDAASATLPEALACSTVVTATTALQPYIDRTPDPGQVYLNVSLRDFHPAALQGAQNILDDTDHCLKAGTSPHLLEQQTGSRAFVTGTIPELLAGKIALDPARGVVVSPFGLGILDLAVGGWVFARAQSAGLLVGIPDFFGETVRW